MPPTLPTHYTHIKRICIIGAGPSSIAALKHLLAEHYFTQIDIFEQRSRLGGVWDYSPENDGLKRYGVPHEGVGDVVNEMPIWRDDSHGEVGEVVSGGDLKGGLDGGEVEEGGEVKERKATFQSPMYDTLEANLPKMLMQHSDLDFPEGTPLFPDRREIERYLVRYAEDVCLFVDSFVFF